MKFRTWKLFRNCQLWKLKIAFFALLLFLLVAKNADAALISKPPTNLGLVGYWSMNEGTGARAGDYSGNRNEGILTSGPTWVDGKRGKALNFDANDDLVNVGTPASLNITGAFTISAWIYPRTFGSVGSTFRGRIVDKENDFISGYSFSLYDPGTAGVPIKTFALFINASGGNLNCFGNNNSIVLNKWQHVTVTLDSSKRCIPYVNGAKATTTSGFLMGSFPGSGSNAFTIGNNSGNTREFDGRIDEVRVYNRALGAAEIQYLYKSGAATINKSGLGAAKINTSQNNQITNGLVGLWSFNGPDMSGVTAYDRSGQGNDGTLTNGPTRTGGKVGQALNFDGVNDYVKTSRVLTAVPYTISAWINPSRYGSTNYGNPFFYQGTASNDTGTSFYVITGNQGVINGLTYFNQGGGASAISASNVITLNVWQHVVVTTDSAGNGTIYVNGVSKATGNSGTTAPTNNSAYIGVWYTLSDPLRTFQGLIDEVRVYNRALTPAEIKRLYNMGR